MIKVLDTIKFRITESSPLPGAQPSNFGLLFSSASSLGAYNTLYFTNSDGDTFDLTNLFTGSINILYYTGSNIGDGTPKTYTWTKPTNLRLLKVICLGAGGGGGSGFALYNSSHVATGGMGGGGGGITYAQFFAEELPNSVSITVGAGGAGSLRRVTSSLDSSAQIVNATWAQSGSKGDDTSFGSYVIAEGGYGGYGGSLLSIFSGSEFSAEVAVPGGGRNSIPSRGPYSFFGIPGGGYASGFTSTTGSGAHAGLAGNPFASSPYSSLSPPQTSQIYFNSGQVLNETNLQYTGAIPIAGAGGGAGGGRSDTFTNFGGEFGVGNGGSGSGVFTFNGTLTSGSAGGRRASASTDPAIFNTFTASNGSNGNDNVGKDIITQLIQSFPLKGFTASYGLGTGGGGGGCTYFSGSNNRTGKVAGNGGHGGLYGAGGGGGGGCSAFVGSSIPSQGTGEGYPWSGVGGSGSSGLCILVEYY